MLNRKHVLWCLLGLTMVFWLGIFAYGHQDVKSDLTYPIAAKAAKQVASPAFLLEFGRMRDAEKIEDKLQRCLAYPNPANVNWDPKLVDAFCRLSLRRAISWKSMNDALAEHHPEILQQAFDSYLVKTYEPDQHGFLVWVYWRLFQSSSKNELETAQRWVDADPNSAYALVARGTYYAAAAYDARGTAWRSDTPPENFTRMNEYVQKAKVDFDEALRRSPRLIAAYHGLLIIARLTGDENLRYASVKAALALDPGDHWIYDDWMDAAEPKWGGSMEEMQNAVEEASEHADINPLLSRVAARPLCYEAEKYSCTTCGYPADNMKAFQLLQKAAAFGPSVCFLEGVGPAAARSNNLEAAVIYYSQAIRLLGKENMLAWRAAALQSLGQLDWAREDLAKALAHNPNDAYALEHQGYIFEITGLPKDAEKSYMAVLDVDPKNEKGGLALARLYLSTLPAREKAQSILAGLLQRNPKLARAWLYEAVLANGKDERACREALEKYLQNVDRTDFSEKEDIERVQTQLKGLKVNS
jgi:Domain of unknown function (DUF4034)